MCVKRVNLSVLKKMTIRNRKNQQIIQEAVQEITQLRPLVHQLHKRRALVVSKLAAIDKVVRMSSACETKMAMIQEVCRSYFG